MGALLLFGVLAVLMIATRRVEWGGGTTATPPSQPAA